MNILAEIADKTKERVAQCKMEISAAEMKRRAEDLPVSREFAFAKALGGEEISFICEAKKASPSKGLIAPEFPYLQIAKDYEAGGAKAISVLTEPYWFQGSNAYLTEISREVSLPLLRKDFTVDPYMIYEAKVIGASAILLICAILDDAQIKDYRQLAESLGLSALVEAHDAQEVERALNAGAKIVGVNNRDLKTFTVDINNSLRLRTMVPEEILFVSESGIKTPQDIRDLEAHHVNAVLMGETMMRASDRVAALKQMRGVM